MIKIMITIYSLVVITVDKDYDYHLLVTNIIVDDIDIKWFITGVSNITSLCDS